MASVRDLIITGASDPKIRQGDIAILLKSTCDIEPIDMRINITDMTWVTSQNQHAS